jgi:hypothetical protein
MPDGDVPLRDHFQQRLMDLEKRLDQQRSDLMDRLAGMNEFREALKDQTASMATQRQVEELRTHVEVIHRQAAVTSALVAILVSVLIAIVMRFAS